MIQKDDPPAGEGFLVQSADISAAMFLALGHTIRYAAVLSGITLAFVLCASLDRIQDDPGVFSQRGLERAQAIQAEAQIDSSSGASPVWWRIDCFQIPGWSTFQLALEN